MAQVCSGDGRRPERSANSTTPARGEYFVSHALSISVGGIELSATGHGARIVVGSYS
jgi:hypothetical protein